MIIRNIPEEVYAVALDYMHRDRADDGNHEVTYNQIVDMRGWTENELEKSISDYLLGAGSFGDGQEFEDAGGWSMGGLSFDKIND